MASQDVYQVEITEMSVSTGTLDVSLESTVDGGSTWVVEDTYTVTASPQDFLTVVDKTGVDGIKLTYAGGASVTLTVFSMIAYAYNTDKDNSARSDKEHDIK